MLYNEIAEKFITKLTAYTKYNINIMDEKGIIIASRNPERIGSFHEAAFDIIKNNREVIRVSSQDTLLGTKPGVNLSLHHQGKVIGVIGVTGDPEEVHPIALVVKMSMETMLDYEYTREKDSKRQNLKELFFHHLLYENDADQGELRMQARLLNYSERFMRVPILIHFRERVDLPAILARIKSDEKHTSQDISIITRDERILIWKCLPDDIDIFSNYKYIIGEYLHHFLMSALEDDLHFRFFAGTFQDRFNYYSGGYQHCRWLEKYAPDTSRGLFFYDYIDEYMKSQISEIEYHRIFNCFPKKLDEKYCSSYIETMEVLRKNNYNLVSSCRDLYIHKNTLAFRFGKLKERLGTNPIQNSRDRELMEYLLYYLKENK